MRNKNKSPRRYGCRYFSRNVLLGLSRESIEINNTLLSVDETIDRRRGQHTSSTRTNGFLLTSHNEHQLDDCSLNYELNRFLSFKNSHADNSLGAIKILASIGYCYNHNDQSIQCHFCNVKYPLDSTLDILNIRTSTSLILYLQREVQHWWHKPSCTLMNCVSNNIPINPDFSSELLPLTQHDVSNSNDNNLPCVSSFRQSNFRDKAERLQSFDKCSQFENDAVDLAGAGYYYVGTNLQIKCYSCQMSIEEWRIGNNPWIEHNKMNPNCSHIIQNLKIVNRALGIDVPYNIVCKICNDKELNVILLPCKHAAICSECVGNSLLPHRQCPICRTYIKTYMIFYLP